MADISQEAGSLQVSLTYIAENSLLRIDGNSRHTVGSRKCGTGTIL